MSSPSLSNFEIESIARREVPPAYAMALAQRTKLCQHGPIGVRRYFGMHLLGVAFPITAGILLYGWRSLLSLGILLVSTLLAMWVWRHIAARGRQINLADGVWKIILLWLMLPAQLASFSPSAESATPLWPILAGAGFLLAMLQWVLGGLGSGRVHPVVVTYLLLTVFYQQALVPHWVLQKQNLFSGDLLNGPTMTVDGAVKESWFDRIPMANYDAIRSDPASQDLIEFTRGTQQPDRGLISLEGLLRDRMPPLEDLVVGGAAAPIGLGSAVAVIIGGLFLIYRGLIDFRIPLVAVPVAWFALLVLPIPVAVDDRPHWRWLAVHTKDVNWSTAITFVNYEIMAGPMLFMCFFLATAPVVRPMARRGRIIYAVLLGVLVAVFQLYHSVSYGPYVAMLLASMITPTLDRWFPPKPLV